MLVIASQCGQALTQLCNENHVILGDNRSPQDEIVPCVFYSSDDEGIAFCSVVGHYAKCACFVCYGYMFIVLINIHVSNVVSVVLTFALIVRDVWGVSFFEAFRTKCIADLANFWFNLAWIFVILRVQRYCVFVVAIRCVPAYWNLEFTNYVIRGSVLKLPQNCSYAWAYKVLCLWLLQLLVFVGSTWVSSFTCSQQFTDSVPVLRCLGVKCLCFRIGATEI